jgi:hypothetical protein
VPDPLIITNSGPLIVSTNFWETSLAAQGLAHLSINARAFRLLMPPELEETIPEMATGKLVVVSRPRNPSKYDLEIMFDDGTDDPYCLHLSAGQVSNWPAREDDGRDDLEFTVWTQPRRGEGPHQALRRPAAYRSVGSVPCLKPWKKP